LQRLAAAASPPLPGRGKAAQDGEKRRQGLGNHPHEAEAQIAAPGRRRVPAAARRTADARGVEPTAAPVDAKRPAGSASWIDLG